MTDNKDNSQNKKKGFFGKMIEKLDKKMEDKAKKSSCCGEGSDQGKGSPCC